MKNKALLILLGALCAGIVSTKADDDLIRCLSNSVSSLSRMNCSYDRVREWGIPGRFIGSEAYAQLTNAIASNPSQVMEKWPNYATNDFARIIILESTHYAGTNAFKTVLHDIVEMAITNNASCNSEMVIDYACGATTPMLYYVDYNYTDPIVSNALVRAQQIPDIDADDIAFIQDVLNGSRKAFWEGPDGRYLRGLPPLESNE